MNTMRKFKQSWVLFNKKKEKFHYIENFSDLRQKCKAIILDGIADDFEIRYFEDNQLEDTAKISDYF